jgi:hypothetical protein
MYLYVFASCIVVCGAVNITLCGDIPPNFSWHIVTNEDDDATIAKKRLIAPVDNQLTCGNCWAFAIANALSDAYVVSGLVAARPNISPIYLYELMVQLGHCGNEGCDRNRVIWRLNEYGHEYGKGIASDICVSKTTFRCDGVPMHGCDYAGRYETFGVKFEYITNTTDYVDIKSSILSNGPIPISINIDNNFSTKFDVYHESESESIGSHSVSVVGWGVHDNEFFWWCRNSWGPTWGEGGYFKYAATNKRHSLYKNQIIVLPRSIQLETLPQRYGFRKTLDGVRDRLSANPNYIYSTVIIIVLSCISCIVIRVVV